MTDSKELGVAAALSANLSFVPVGDDASCSRRRVCVQDTDAMCCV